jgi:outer membrane protein TolC
VRFDPELQAGATATLVQPLLKGLRFDDARADHRTSLQARDIAGSTLNAAIATTKLEVQRAYWLWVYTRDYLSVQRQSLQLAQELLDGNRARVAAGAMAAVDVIEAQAEVARRTESIAIAEKDVANTEDLVRMLAFDPGDPRWSAPLEPSVVEPEPLAAAGLVERALGSRQDLASLRASVAIEDIALKRARNDTLPDASLRAGYSVRGVGGADYRSLLDDLARSRYPAWSFELSVSYPIGQARAEADAARASLRRQQAEAAVKAAEQRVAMEVRAALREVEANRRRLDLTATAVTLAERRLEAEQRKFAVGLSTSFFVFHAQRDLSQAREAALRSTLDYRAATAEIAAVPVIPLTR